MKDKLNERLHWTTTVTEKIMLGGIGALTVVAALLEVWGMWESRNIALADLFLLFIYTEVLGMIGIFFVSKRIPITLPIFIEITAITRLIILQGKDMDMILLLYESGAILILSLAILAVRFRPKNYYSYQTDD